MKRNTKSMRGVTLIEIAIVLVIIGLLLGGILKGQELINNAKVRAIADRQSALKIAWFAFIDRYRALPGDYVQAEVNIEGAGPTIQAATNNGVGFGDGVIAEGESPYVLQHLTGAGFLRCPTCTYAPAAWAVATPNATNSLQNQYGGIMAIFVDGSPNITAQTDAQTYLYDTSQVALRAPRLMVHTGQNIPSNIIAEVDRKIDDGFPQYGDFRASDYRAIGIIPVTQCLDADNEDGIWTDVGDYESADAATGWRAGSIQPEANCGAAIII